ncbi:MAG: AMP-binding protein [Verrucomicrobiales bacterium]
MKGIRLLHSDFLPASGALVVPTRLNAAEAGELHRHFSGRIAVILRPENLAQGDTEVACQAVKDGGFAVFQPSPSSGWRGSLSDLPRDTMEALLELGLPVVPLAIDRPGESALAIESSSSLPEAVLVFGRLIEADQLTVPRLLEGLLLASEEAFSRRSTFNASLAYVVLRAIKKHGTEARVIDGTDDSSLTYASVLAAAIALSQLVKQETQRARVGIVLPPGKAALIANLAVLLAGKVPVNLNFTAGKEAVESAMRQAELDRYLTVDLVVRKMQGFPWPPTKHLVLLERVMPQLKSKARLWGALARVLPTSLLASMLKIPREGGDGEAALLFTSGSSGEPKGVVLSHRNLIANVTQFGARLSLGPHDRALGCLPLFHSFGCTVTMWYPLIEGFGLVTYPSPLEAPKLAALIEKYGITLLLSTPTFLRGYLRRVAREQLASLKLVVTGAEKLPASVAETFKETFGLEVMEGYGLTETSPAASLNLPAKAPEDDVRPVMPSHRPGSVGQLLPGVAIRITDAATDRPLPIDKSGVIWLKGANIFRGYLKQPGKTAEVLQDGWFRTGDIGRMDSDGFLYIEGRLSRFSKIGGEMVPHETVEEHITKALRLEGEVERKIAVVGVPDPDKGEALVLLSTVAGETIKQELIELRYALLERGVPALWIPKKLMAVSEIPLLASGKLDIKKCEELAHLAD